MTSRESDGLITFEDASIVSGEAPRMATPGISWAYPGLGSILRCFGTNDYCCGRAGVMNCVVRITEGGIRVLCMNRGCIWHVHHCTICGWGPLCLAHAEHQLHSASFLSLTADEADSVRVAEVKRQGDYA